MKLTTEEKGKEIRRTREARVKEAFEKAVDYADYEILKYYAMLYLGRELDEANRALYHALTNDTPEIRSKFFVHDHWSLLMAPTLIRLYYYFGSHGRYPGRLYSETEDALLEFLWESMLTKNDVHLARQSVWWMTGSENHDINFKACSMLSSQIFMEHPRYQERVYPDLGRGGGSGYWFEQMYPGGLTGIKDGHSGRFAPGGDLGIEDRGPEGRGGFKDGKEYIARDHWEEWTAFWKRYLLERVKKGFFLEVNATGYMKWTLSFLSLILEFTKDSTLREMCRSFFDVIWAQWAQDQIDLRSGGARTRAVLEGPSLYEDSMNVMARFLTGGQGNACHNYYFQLLSDYELPEIVLRMAIDKAAMGSFEFASRKPGEEENVWPRPLGAERTMLCDTPSRLLCYSYVTPEYIMGTQMDHPAAVHSHLSSASRSQGIILRGDKRAIIMPCGVRDSDNGLVPSGRMYRSVQKRSVLIAQQSRGWIQINPEWYPHSSMDSEDFGVFFAMTFECIEREMDLVFVKHADVYVAARVAYGGYRWADEGRFLILNDRFSPLIFETATASEMSFDKFRNAVRSADFSLLKTVVQGWVILQYESTITGDKFYFNAANNEIPMVNGEYIDYAPQKVISSPYIQSKYGSGVVNLALDGKSKTYDFNAYRQSKPD
ncbi:MAG: hypothetical protein ACOX8S_05635 [Christensenellales bacterium]|jgi:hypothetical protein